MIEYAIYWVIGTVALATTAYFVVRAGSIGHFRTRRDYFNLITRQEDMSDGKEE